MYFSPAPLIALWIPFWTPQKIMFYPLNVKIGWCLFITFLFPHAKGTSHPRVPWLKVPLSWVPCPPVHTSPVHKSPSHTFLVHMFPIHTQLHSPLLVTACHSLIIYTSTALYVTNWQPVGDTILDLPLPLNLLIWASAWLGDTLKTDRNRMF